MRDLMSELFKWDQDIFLQALFLGLDTNSLRRCREVSTQWKEYIDRRVWGCAQVRQGLVSRLWKDFQPIQQRLVVRGSVTSIACDDELIVCGYTDGDAEVFSNVTGDCLEILSDKQEEFHYSSSKVKLGKDIIVKIAYGCDQYGKFGKSSVGVWRKDTFDKVFEIVDNIQKDCVYLQVHENDVFLRKGKVFSKIGFHQMWKQQNQILEENMSYVKAMTKGDFLTDGIHFISHRKHQIFFFKLDDESVKNISMKTNIVNMTMNMKHLLILQEFSFSVINLNTEEICLKGTSSTQLISTSSNPQVVAILDARNSISIFSWTDLLNPNLSTCLPITTLLLPLPTSSYTSPCLSLSQTALTAASAGSNCVLSYQLWRGAPKPVKMRGEEEREYLEFEMKAIKKRKTSGAGIRDY